MFYSNATTTGIQELNLGAASTFLMGQGTSAIPTWTASTGTGNVMRGTGPQFTLKQSTAPAPVDNGDIRWDSDDFRFVVGTGVTQRYFYSKTGNDALYFPFSGGQLTGNITFSGSQTVDGKDVSTLVSGANVHDTANDLRGEIHDSLSGFTITDNPTIVGDM